MSIAESTSLKRKIDDLTPVIHQGKEKSHKDNDWDPTIQLVTNFFQRGCNEYFNGNYEKATLFFYRCQEYGTAPCHLYLGHALEEQFGVGFEGAIEAYKTALSWSSLDGHFSVYARLGMAYKSRYQIEQPQSIENLHLAKEAFESALKVDGVPENLQLPVRQELEEVIKRIFLKNCYSNN